MFARFDENPAKTLQDIKETKRYGRKHGWTHAHTDGQRENSIPTTNKVCGGYKNSVGTDQLILRNIIIKKINKPWHEISSTVVCATSKASDQHRAFASRLNIL